MSDIKTSEIERCWNCECYLFGKIYNDETGEVIGVYCKNCWERLVRKKLYCSKCKRELSLFASNCEGKLYVCSKCKQKVFKSNSV